MEEHLGDEVSEKRFRFGVSFDGEHFGNDVFDRGFALLKQFVWRLRIYLSRRRRRRRRRRVFLFQNNHAFLVYLSVFHSFFFFFSTTLSAAHCSLSRLNSQLCFCANLNSEVRNMLCRKTISENIVTGFFFFNIIISCYKLILFYLQRFKPFWSWLSKFVV